MSRWVSWARFRKRSSRVRAGTYTSMLTSRMPSFWVVWVLTRRSASTPITVTQLLPTLSGLPIGSSVVKKRDRTPSPMIATGRPRSTCSGVNGSPLASARFVSRKYDVSTPTTLLERCRPSRVIVVFRTISAQAASTPGITRAIASASAYVSPGANCFTSFSDRSSIGPSLCSTSGVIIRLLEPSRRSCSRISRSAPLPMASMAMTEATPNRIPSEVRKARSLLCRSASTAVRNVELARGPSSTRSRARVARSRRTTSILVGRLPSRVAGRGCHTRAGGRQPREREALGVRGRRQQHPIVRTEAADDDHLVVVHRARDDLLLDDPSARLLVHERQPAFAAERLEGHEQRVGDLERLDRVAGSHAGAQRRVRLLDLDLYLEHLRVGVGALLSYVSDARHLTGEALGGIGVQRDRHGLPHGHFADVDLVDIGDGFHVGEVGKLGDPGIPDVHLRARRPLLAVPFLSIDDHSRAGRLDGEAGHEILHRFEQPALACDLGTDFAHLGLRLLGLGLVVRLGLRQCALGLLVIDLRLTLDRGRLVDGLLLGEPLFLEPQLHGPNVLPCRGEVERRVEHRLLVLRLRLLEGEGHFLELRGDGGPVELGDDVPLLHHRAFGHDRGDLDLVDARLLPAGRHGDLDELARAQLARRRDDHPELPALHGCYHRGICCSALARQQPCARDSKREHGRGDSLPARIEEAHGDSFR